MTIFEQIPKIRAKIADLKKNNLRIGLVPTMGALHNGHLSLLHYAKKECDIVVCSIFVNPSQFNNRKDFENYPRHFEKDLAMLEAEGCDIIFSPSEKELYKNKTMTSVTVREISEEMEGKFRPGHFDGVGLIVCKLFNIIHPDFAYFGQKDLQQYLIIKQIVEDLSFPITLRCLPIIRESGGLAMSSRNQRLSDEEKQKAQVLYKLLVEAGRKLIDGQLLSEVKQYVDHSLKAIDGVALEYFEAVNVETLKPLSEFSSYEEVALCIASYVGEVRLIDNIFLSEITENANRSI